MSNDQRKKLEEVLSKITGEDQATVESVVGELVQSIRVSIVNEGKACIADGSGEDDEKPGVEEATAKLQRMAEQREQFLARAQSAEKTASEALQQIETLQGENSTLNEKLVALEEIRAQYDELKESYDNLESSLSEKFEENLQTEMRARIRRVGTFIESKIQGMRENIREEIARDPSNVTESALFRQIADLIESHSSINTAKAVAEPQTAIIDENLALKAQTRLLEAQNAKMREEAKKMQEQKTAPAPVASNPSETTDKKKEVPVVVESEKPAAEPKDETVPAEDNKPIQEAAKTAPRKLRASELMAESMAATDKGSAEVPSWISESRQGRIERSNQVEPKGIPVGTGDLIQEVVKEDGNQNTQAKNGQQIVRGTGGATLEETRRLSGIPVNG